MSRLIEITKDGSNYTVNPDAHPGSSILYAWGVFYDDTLEWMEENKINEEYNTKLKFISSHLGNIPMEDLKEFIKKYE